MKSFVTVNWACDDLEKFLTRQYSRGHTWKFDGGVVVNASASPEIVPAPYSLQNAVDPEEAFVASISSCHMLWFLHLAADDGLLIEKYTDNAVGTLEKASDGKMRITDVVLSPQIIFGNGFVAEKSVVDELHTRAHENCFIANSVNSKITVKSR